MSGNKPEIKIAIKPVDGGNRVDLFAFWRRDNGKLSGSLDKRIRGVRIVMEDGTKHDLYKRDGKHTHWIDCFEGRPPADNFGANESGDSGGGGDDWGDDQIPFREVDDRLT